MYNLLNGDNVGDVGRVEVDAMSSQARSLSRPTTGNYLRLSNVDWRIYTRLLHAFEEKPGVRLTYDRGELEIMSPSMAHDGDGRFVGDVVVVLTEELGLPLKRGGSTTLRRRLKQRGIEADECFWIANAHRMAGRRQLDLRTDPPPDLAIEIDVTRSSLNRMSIYAALGVPEVWRLDGNTMSFYILDAGGSYASAAASLSFPLVTPADLPHFLDQARQAGDENTVMRQFRVWIRQRIAATGAPPAP
jgi:Uma2 family endonuclease